MRDIGIHVKEFQISIAIAAALRDEAGLDLSYMDLGGGFAAPYATSGQRPRYAKLNQAMTESLDERLPGWRTGRPEIAFESGRYSSATAEAWCAPSWNSRNHFWCSTVGATISARAVCK